MKTHTTLSVDFEILNQAKEMGNINLSEIFTNALKVAIESRADDDEEITKLRKDLVVLKKKKQEIKEEERQVTLKESILVVKIREKEEEQKKTDKKNADLVEEKKKEKFKCMICKSVVSDEKRMVLYGKGRICKGCYQTATTQELNKVSEGVIHG